MITYIFINDFKVFVIFVYFNVRSIEDKIKQMESKIMTLVEESCVISARTDSDDQNESKKEQNLSQARI